MEELITRITANAGLDESKAREAVRIILTFLYREGDRDKIVSLASAIPGSELYVDAVDDDSAGTLGGLGGLMGGGAMAVLGQLQNLGLGMGQIQSVAQETVAFAREKAGPDLVNDVVSSIPGLSQFV